MTKQDVLRPNSPERHRNKHHHPQSTLSLLFLPRTSPVSCGLPRSSSIASPKGRTPESRKAFHVLPRRLSGCENAEHGTFFASRYQFLCQLATSAICANIRLSLWGHKKNRNIGSAFRQSAKVPLHFERWRIFRRFFCRRRVRFFFHFQRNLERACWRV